MASKKSDSKSKSGKAPRVLLSDVLRLPEGPVDVTTLETDAAPGYPGKGKADVQKYLEAIEPTVSDLQERLYANARGGNRSAPRVIVLLQGLDTAGKGGVIRHAISLMDSQGIKLTSFKAPTAIERRHDFLWRIRRAVPERGLIGIFARSHYEDVLIVRVEKLVPKSEWSKRYDIINDFEAELAGMGVTLIKCFLNVSKDEQKVRLQERLDNPEKYWKYNPDDLKTRAKWDDYMAAYSDLLTKCNTEVAPWFVIPADKKWYRNWAVATLLLEHLEALNLQWPEATYDVEVEKAKLAKA